MEQTSIELLRFRRCRDLHGNAVGVTVGRRNGKPAAFLTARFEDSAPAPEPDPRPEVSIPDVRPAPRAGASGRWLVVSAFVAGAIVASYRNDVLRHGARAVGLEPAFLRVEQALGGPGFGTPHAIERLTER